MVANNYVTTHDLSQPDIVDLLTSGFTGMLKSWWENHLTGNSREKIKNAIQKDNNGLPIFDGTIGCGVSDGVNTLIYTIVEHFIGTPSNITARIHDQLTNLTCPTISDFRWYKDVFLSRVIIRDDSNKPFWKEKFINSLPNLFAHKIRETLIKATGFIDYDNLTYGNIISLIQKEGLRMCIDMKISNQLNDDRKRAKYEMGTFCEQYGLPPIAPSRQKTNAHKKSYKSDKGYRRNYKNRKTVFPKIEYYSKEKRKPKRTFGKNNASKKDTKDTSKDVSKVKCFKCGRLGHFAKDYYAKKKIRQLQISEDSKESLYQILQL
ncbi:uncharacterized protein LOC132296207 [Cornus florida]|uniref:uncharacterized protein LOC132296207 n=1 Tax=Cornus florida TaxID=4283 RepID=UPI00289B1B3D|nr:uncharacterized protein LOC132296207 [Cornus florida]